MPTAKYRHYGCRITDDLIYKGYRTLFLENELVRVGVLLDKGADIFQFLHKPSDTDFLWRSPQGLIARDRFIATRASASGAFLDSYHGGWQEILPGGGPVDYPARSSACTARSPSWAGIATSWKIPRNASRCACRWTASARPSAWNASMTLEQGQPGPLHRRDPAPTSRLRRMDFMWGHHPAFGAPFLHEGVRLFVPAGAGPGRTPRSSPPSSILEPGMQFAWPLALSRRQIDRSFLRPGDRRPASPS